MSEQPDSPGSAKPRRFGVPQMVGHADMRSANMGLVLRTLATHGAMSQTTLVREVGMSKGAVSSIVSDLESRGLVSAARSDARGRVGRPSLQITVERGRVCGIGIELRSEDAVSYVADLAGEVVSTTTRPLPYPLPAPEILLDLLAEMARGALADAQQAGLWPAGIMIAAPGVIDYETGSLRFASNLGLRNVPITTELRQRLGDAAPPIGLESDAKLSALAAASELAPDGVRDLLFLTGDAGVACGIVADGKLVRGYNGLSGEVGHLTVDPSGAQCPCGRTGCWELFVSVNVLLAAVPPGHQAWDRGLPLGERLRAVRALYDEGNPRVHAAIDSIARYLALGASILVDVLNPQNLILGGYFAQFCDVLAPPVSEHLRARLIDAGGGVRIHEATRGELTAAAGGAIVVLEEVLTNPSIVPPLQPAS